MSWEIIVGLISLVSFIGVFWKLSSNLSSAIARLECSVNELTKAIDKSERKIETIEHTVSDHEVRISVLEEK